MRHHPGMSTNSPAKLLPIFLFNAAYMAAAVTGSIVQGNHEFIFYIVVMAVLIGVASTIATLLFMALGWWVNRRTQAWRLTSR